MKQVMFASHRGTQALLFGKKNYLIKRKLLFFPGEKFSFQNFLVTLEQKTLLQQYSISLISYIAQPYQKR